GIQLARTKPSPRAHVVGLEDSTHPTRRGAMIGREWTLFTRKPAESGERRRFATSRGHCLPFGATPRPGGINFAVFSRHAQRVDLVLFEEGREQPIAEFPLDPTLHKTGDVWHVFVHGLKADVLYGYRAHGPSMPKAGH